MMTTSGGEYAYLSEVFGSVPAFLFSWISLMVTRTTDVAVLCLALAEYATGPIFGKCGPPPSVRRCVAATVLSTPFEMIGLSHTDIPNKSIARQLPNICCWVI